ncbi:MAG: PAS domain S-box protein, partial [Betaproteobacteria bacterium]|nr:PAS domain S-box protein [Betaproteobacteria bacterium]
MVISIRVDTFARDLQDLRLPEGARIVLISDKGDVVARAPDPEGFTGKNMANSDLVRKRNEFEGEGVDEVKGLDGVRRVSAFTQFIRTHDGELTLLLAVAISNRYLIRPLIILSETSRRLGAGNLAVRSGLNETGGEIGAVARAFDDMAEELMRATQEREHDFRALIENMIEACRIIDRDWKYVYVNAAFSRETGLPPEALIGHTPLELFAAARDSEWHMRCQRVMETRIPESFEGPLFFGDRPSGWAQYHVQPVREGIFIFSANLTERESARHALGARMKELHCLYEVFRTTESADAPVATRLERVVCLLPPAWQYPDDTVARIVFGGATFLAGEFRETPWMQTVVFGEKDERGEISVAYRSEHAEAAEGPFLREERTLLEAIANRLTGMIERHRALLSVQRSNRAVSAINACSTAIIRADNEADALSVVCKTIVEQGGYYMAWVGMAEHDAGSTVRPVAFAGAGSDYIAELKVSWADNALGRGPTGRAIRSRRPEVARRIVSDPAYALWREAALKHGYASSVALPLILGSGECIGALNVYATVAEAFDTEEMALLAAFANDLALGIHAHRDRVERLRAQEVERQLAFVVEQTTNAVMITDLDARLKYVNEAFVRSSGYSREEVIGQNPRILKSGRTPRATYEAMWAALTGGRPWNGELFNRHKNGALQILRTMILPLRDSSGSVTHYVGLTEDVTAGKAAEEQLRKLSLAVEQSPESVVITNLAAEIEYVNESFLKVTGYTREEVMGQNPRVLHSGNTPSATYEQLWATLARGEPWKGEFFNRRK